jgi:hypothetical protein
MSQNCFKCNTTLDLVLSSDVGRSEECPKCFSNIRCCKMCGFFDTKAYNECREPTADRIVEKEKANFCDHYKLGAGGTRTDQKDEMLAKANSLFK